MQASLRTGDTESRIVVGIAGVPGSGKSTLAQHVCQRANDIYRQRHPEFRANIAIDVPMDGFHYSRARLRDFPPEQDAVHRRGAAFTYDAEGFYQLVRELVSKPMKEVMAPSFDHAVKDPVDGTYRITTSHKIVLLEGNYCALDRRPWSDAANLLSELWYIDVPSEIAHRRLAKRHLASGIVEDENEAWLRATGTDELNAQDIRQNRLKCTEVV